MKIENCKGEKIARRQWFCTHFLNWIIKYVRICIPEKKNETRQPNESSNKNKAKKNYYFKFNSFTWKVHGLCILCILCPHVDHCYVYVRAPHTYCMPPNTEPRRKKERGKQNVNEVKCIFMINNQRRLDSTLLFTHIIAYPFFILINILQNIQR